MAELVYLRNVVTLRLAPEKCTGCGKCLEVCPRNVLALQDKKLRLAEKDRCIECGACVRNCPFDALWVKTGVGCAAAVINSALGRTGSDCCCVEP